MTFYSVGGATYGAARVTEMEGKGRWWLFIGQRLTAQRTTSNQLSGRGSEKQRGEIEKDRENERVSKNVVGWVFDVTFYIGQNLFLIFNGSCTNSWFSRQARGGLARM